MTDTQSGTGTPIGEPSEKAMAPLLYISYISDSSLPSAFLLMAPSGIMVTGNSFDF